MRPAAILFCALLSACVSVPTVAREPVADTLVCPHVQGTYAGPYIGREETARAIAVAIIDALPAPRDRTYELLVLDRGDHWVAFQSPLPRDSRIRGGGGLQMRIAKCDGAVSGVSFQR